MTIDQDAWQRRHHEHLREAMSWPCWYFLSHGCERDPKVLLKDKAFGIVFHDRALKRLTQDYDA